MGPKTSRDLPEPTPRGNEERDTRQAIVEDAAENDGKHRDLVHGDGGGDHLSRHAVEEGGGLGEAVEHSHDGMVLRQGIE